MAMSSNSRAALEINRRLQVLSAFAVTDLGELEVLALEPEKDLVQLERERQLVEEVALLFELDGALLFRKEEPWAESLERLSCGRGIAPSHLLALASLLESFESAQSRLSVVGTPRLLSELHRALAEPDPEAGQGPEAGAHEESDRERARLAAELSQQVRAVLDVHGAVRPDATPELASLGSSVRRTRDRLYSSFQTYASEHGAVLGDDTITRAEGRLAVLLPSGHRGRLPGIVHSSSSTGKSYYFEPLELVEENNRLQKQRAQEEAERARILRQLAGLFEKNAGLIERVGRFVARLDRWQAAHRFRLQVEGQVPEMKVNAPWRLHGARHPLLDPRLASLREKRLGSSGHCDEVVPLEVAVGDDRVLVLTGPNAGGKTVALKTLGVASFLASCGWPVPLAQQPVSCLPFFTHWIAVVGDEQDVLAERSTFSARLERLSEVWDVAEAGALVLLDEVGSGTNPEEGAALAIALLERLVERGCYAIITTHLLQVANAALALPGCTSLAMELDAKTGHPSFRVRAGAPGSSHALDLARRLGLAEDWVQRAEELLGEEQLTLRHLIAETESSRQRAMEIERELSELQGNQEVLQRRQQEELSKAREERLAARSKATGELERFRRSAREELTRELRRSRSQTQSRESATSPKSAAKVAARRAAQLVAESELARSLADGAAQAARERVPPDPGTPLAVGDSVRHTGFGWTGKIDQLRGASGDDQKVEVLVRGKRVRCLLSELARDPTADKAGGKIRLDQQSGSSSRAKKPTVTVETSATTMGLELVLVGQRVEPALVRLDAYLDQAILADLASVRVVHGYGSGRLKEAVRQHLSSHPLVASMESAAPELGGGGATIVVLRED